MGVFREKVMVFVRDPVPGRVKTRLIGKLSRDEVCRLYRCFVEDTLANLALGRFHVAVCFDPPESRARLTDWLGKSYEYEAQEGDSLGERMQRAFAGTFAQHVDRAVLIGSDLPDLEAETVRWALDCLKTRDVVLGPAADGGYYLIGFRRTRYDPSILEDTDWGGPRVLETTVKRIKNRDLDLHLLPQRYDIDTYRDLQAFFKRARRGGESHLRTVEYLRGNPGVLER